MKKKFIKDPIYESYFWFVWDTDIEELRVWILKNYNYELEVQDNHEHLGKTIMIEGDGSINWIIWINNKKNIPSLAHELLHKTIDVLRRSGLSLTEESEEAYAYLFSFYFKECLKSFKVK